MTTTRALAKEQRIRAERLRAELNTALEHVYRAYQGLNSIVLADTLDGLHPVGTVIATARMRGRLFDLWLDGATLMTDVQHSLASEQGVSQPEKEGR